MGKDYIVTDSKNLTIAIDKAGKTYIDFNSPLIVEKDDILAFYFSKSVTVPYDSGIGTNVFLSMKEDQHESGGQLAADDVLATKQTKRKYSLNYYGIFLMNK
jgi:hypothetical protein